MDGVFKYSILILIYFCLDHVITLGQIFEEPTLQFIECKQPDINNQFIASSQEQLISSAKYNNKSTKVSFFIILKNIFSLVQERVFKEFYSYTFPSEYMSFQSFSDAMDNKLIGLEKSKLAAYFRAFDAQQNCYLTYSDYLLG